jgi:multiple sugar transport system substrate-binding protein
MRLSRTAGIATLAAATLLLATACSSASSASTGSASSTDVPTGPVTLTMWGTYGRGGNSAQADMLLKTIIPAFEKAHPTITVNYVDQNYDSLLQKLTTGAAGGTLPDLVRADIGWVPKLGALGVLAQLDQLMPDFQKLSSDTYPGILATNKWQATTTASRSTRTHGCSSRTPPPSRRPAAPSRRRPSPTSRRWRPR